MLKKSDSRRSMRRLGAATFMLFALGAFTQVGCEGDLAENIDEAFDCRKVCNRYQECFDSSYDVSACVDRCTEGRHDGNSADACESCIDEAACSESFVCAAACAGVVP